MRLRPTLVTLSVLALLGLFYWKTAGRPLLAGVHSDVPTLSLGVFTGLSLDEARERAETGDRLLVVDLSATWCPPCRAMEATTWVDASVQQWFDRHGVALQIDVDQLPDVARRFGARAYPTVVMLREGREVGRVVGYRDAEQLLDWLEDLRLERPAAPTRIQRDPARYTGVPDTPPHQPLLRHLLVGPALAEGRLDEALDQSLWLWAHGAKHSATFSVVRGSFLLGNIQTLVQQHPPARPAFEALRDQVQAQVEGGTLSLGCFSDWLGLCWALGDTDRIDAWIEAHRAPEGHLVTDPAWDQSWLVDSLFDLLIRDGRWAEAGRLHERPSRAVSRRLSLVGMARASTAGMPGVLGNVMETAGDLGLDRAQERGLRVHAANLHAAALAAGREDEALRCAELLLSRLDDAESRLLLVRTALDHATHGPRHLAWFAEAAAAGADVAELEARLAALGDD